MKHKKSIVKVNRALRQQILRHFPAVVAAVVVTGVIAGLGVHASRQSHAANVGTLAMVAANGTATVDTGSQFQVAIVEDSGTEAVNAVQAAITYDASRLQYVGIADSTDFPTIAATSTATAGLIRIGRATVAKQSISGKHTVTTIKFQAKNVAGSARAGLRPGFLIRGPR